MVNLFGIISHYPGCLFHSITGLYCPGCGGTRAVRALLRGEILRSFFYHPVVVYGLIAFIYILVGWLIHFVRVRTHQTTESYRFPDWTLWGALIVLGVNFVVKNGALIIFGLDLLNILDRTV